MNGAVAAAAAIAQAIKASGTIVNLEYLTSYKGLAFFCKSSTALNLPSGHEVVLAQKIWIP